MNRVHALLLIIGLCFIPASKLMAQPDSTQPNIVVLLVDDAALMDFGVFGGEARTPNIDQIASDGVMFTQYRTSPLCAPTRAMLLTGVDNHLTGVATIPEVLPEEQSGQPGYTMALEENVLTVADRLRTSGYRTMMAGKWHLGEEKHQLPQAHGFDRSFVLAASGADNWEDKSFMPFYKDAPWYEGTEPADLPDDFYSSRFIVDKVIEYIGDTDPSKPFFAYLPFQAIHVPVQAPSELIANYDGVYDQGWHQLRTERHQRAQALGLVPAGAALAPMPKGSRDWQELSDDERLLYTKRMQVNAAMLEAMDIHIGRLVDYLEQQQLLDNTIIVVTSDNGAEASRGDDDTFLKTWFWLNDYHVGLENIGGASSWGFIGPEWASAASAPSALYKFYAAEGGVRVPLIIKGPGITPTKTAAHAMVTDITPTLLDWAQASEAPSTSIGITGRSLLPVLQGATQNVYAKNDVRAIEVSGNTALYKGDYKITRAMPPMGDGSWSLFNLTQDPGETTDLRNAEPQKLEELLKEYASYTQEMGVLEMPAGYDSKEQLRKNSQTRMSQIYKTEIVTFLAIVVLLVLVLFWLIRRRRA